MKGFNRILDLIGILNIKKYNTLDKVGQFCKGKMDFYVPVDTGKLKSKNTYNVSRFFYQKLRLVNDCEYAGYVENGTSKMRAQPFIRPAMENHLAEIRQIVSDEMRL